MQKHRNMAMRCGLMIQFILDILTDIPQVGEQVKYNNMVFTVQTVENNRIGKVRIEKGNEVKQ